MEFFTNITIHTYILISMILFIIGMIGIIINRSSIIAILLAIELMLVSVNINFVAFANYHNSIDGQIMALSILAIAAAESAVGLAILVCYFRHAGNIDITGANRMRG